MKIKLTISYDGTEYKGWQVQPDYPNTVQQIVKNAIKEITGEDVTLTGSGRTDAGVHAEGQVASFVSNSTVPAKNFYRALNTVLPSGVKVLASEQVPDDFDARRSAKKKLYRYSVYLGSADKPLKARYAERVYGELDVEKMRESASLLVGEHDFKAFCASGSEVNSTVRTIYYIDVIQNGEDVFFNICGNGFLYNMVRIIVGTLIKVGKGQLDKTDVEAMLTKLERSYGGQTISPKGLCLVKVEY